MPVSPGPVLPKDMNARQWAEFLTQSGVQGDRTVKSFTPTWSGFSANPTGDMFYMDFGAIVMMWTANGFAGTSNSAFFSITGVPADILPSGLRIVPVSVEDNSIPDKLGAAFVSTTGIGFGLGNVPAGGGALSFLSGGWTNPGGKGLSPGALIIYAK